MKNNVAQNNGNKNHKWSLKTPIHIAIKPLTKSVCKGRPKVGISKNVYNGTSQSAPYIKYGQINLLTLFLSISHLLRGWFLVDKRNRNPEHKTKEGTKQSPRNVVNVITPGEAMPAFNGQKGLGFL